MYKLEYKNDVVSVEEIHEEIKTNYGVYLENDEFIDNSKIDKVILKEGGYFAYSRSSSKKEFLELIHTSLETRKNQLRSQIRDIMLIQSQIHQQIEKER